MIFTPFEMNVLAFLAFIIIVLVAIFLIIVLALIGLDSFNDLRKEWRKTDGPK